MKGPTSGEVERMRGPRVRIKRSLLDCVEATKQHKKATSLKASTRSETAYCVCRQRCSW